MANLSTLIDVDYGNCQSFCVMLIAKQIIIVNVKYRVHS